MLQDNDQWDESQAIEYIEKVLTQHERDTLQLLVKEAHNGKA